MFVLDSNSSCVREFMKTTNMKKIFKNYTFMLLSSCFALLPCITFAEVEENVFAVVNKEKIPAQRFFDEFQKGFDVMGSGQCGKVILELDV